ncbi:MAG TPA: ABC transporter ATP-binding protein [Candidatus Acidoferrales bacterium]|nr:ABC transporter ATP-binding protein [Candidatus Acidoferrales bacterium]
MVSQASLTEASNAAKAAPPDACGPVLRADNLRKIFHSGGSEVIALAGVTLSVARGEIIAVVGPSGSGKSTLLHLLAGLDTPTSGTVYFAGHSLEAITEREREDLRSHAIGFVWQRHQLLADFSAAENVAMPLLIRGVAAGEALKAASDWLGEVGLADRARHRAGELSGGEQQRVAIARALVNRPSLMLADEPTGDLDERNAESIFELMEQIHRTQHLTSILATHNMSLARRADRVFVLEHGALVADEGAFVARTSHRAMPGDVSAPGGRG